MCENDIWLELMSDLLRDNNCKDITTGAILRHFHPDLQQILTYFFGSVVLGLGVELSVWKDYDPRGSLIAIEFDSPSILALHSDLGLISHLKAKEFLYIESSLDISWVLRIRGIGRDLNLGGDRDLISSLVVGKDTEVALDVIDLSPHY
jgi:hypothetical protein